MQKVGVEAVVEGLNAFLGDMNQMNRSMDKLRPQGTLLQRAFSGITDSLASLGREILNVAEVALGVLLARAVEFVVGKLKELIGATIEAGSEFQTMQLRLNRLNFNAIVESGSNYVGMMDAAKAATQEQLEWIRKLAVQTPYDAQDIANVFTLARSYGFAAEEAKGLTEDISDFAAGMGLGNVEIERIIVNFGQMVQQGKVTQREMNDLARGAFVPVNDVLERMQKNLGLTDDELTEFRKTGEGVQEFFKAFSQVVEERFQGAAQDMARTFQGATANAQDFLKSLFGFNVVMPILDAVGGALADFISALTEPERWKILDVATKRLGGEIIKLIGAFVGVKGLNMESVFLGIVKAIGGITNWIQKNRGNIVDFFKGIGTTIQTKFVPFILKVVDAFNTIRDWVKQNSETIGRFFTALGEIVAKVFSNLFGTKIETGGLEGFLGGITTFMEAVIANKDAIAEWATIIAKVVFWFQVGATILSIFMGVVIAIITPIIAIAGLLAGLAGLWTILGTTILAVAGFIVTVLIPGILLGIGIFLTIIAVIAMVVAAFFSFILTITTVKHIIEDFVASALQRFEEFKTQVVEKVEELRARGIEKFEELKTQGILNFEELKAQIFAKLIEIVATMVEKAKEAAQAWLSISWYDIGSDIMDGIHRAIVQKAQRLINQIVKVAEAMYDAAMSAIKSHSPSKLFENVGDSMMEGMAIGIEKSTRMVMDTMKNAMGMAIAPALRMPALAQQFVAAGPAVSSTNTLTNNFNLTVNSRAPTEPIIQDYDMMRSLVQR